MYNFIPYLVINHPFIPFLKMYTFMHTTQIIMKMMTITRQKHVMHFCLRAVDFVSINLCNPLSKH